MADVELMRLAITLAREGRGATNPNPMVGAVVVRDGEVVGQGYHARVGGPHAEVAALEQAGLRARGATLYVNLEPCTIHGRTPPCTDAIIAAGIVRVVVAMEDPNPFVSGRGIQALISAGIVVEQGLLEGEAQRLNEAYVKHVRSGFPFVIMKAAITLDGKICTGTGESQWISGKESLLRVHEMRAGVDALVVGVGTIIADNPMLTVRNVPKAKDPVRMVLDAGLRIPDESTVLDPTFPVTVVTTDRSSSERRKELEQRGIAVWVVEADEHGEVDLRAFLRQVGERDMISVQIEGGAEIYTSFLRAGMVDKVALFIAPTLLGEGKSVVGDLGIERLSNALHLRDAIVERLGEDVLIQGYL
jgi:diaminohydroxyphosphoribosylaminopyrimidine deaminase/5-amino-6-(5-phosphoribosylamino)uracil reductase